MSDSHTATEVRNVASGFQAVTFHGCSLRDGAADPSTAEEIVKSWAPTEAEAEALLPLEASDV